MFTVQIPQQNSGKRRTKERRMTKTISMQFLAVLAMLVCLQSPVHAFNLPDIISKGPNVITKGKSGASESQVIEAAKRVMANTGYFNPIDSTLFADDFIFRGPVIGPLNKDDYEEVLEYFSIYKAFPDMNPNCFGFTVDPENPLRVWYFVRATGTYQNPLGGPIGSIVKPNNEVYRGSPETWSLTFDENLKARLITAGYVSDRFDENATTDGTGLSFGILKTIGISLFSGPGDLRLRLIQAINGPLVKAGISPKAVSAPEDVPSWWKNQKRGADP